MLEICSLPMCTKNIEFRMKCNKISITQTTPRFCIGIKRLWCGFEAGDTEQLAEMSPSKHLKQCGNYQAKKKCRTWRTSAINDMKNATKQRKLMKNQNVGRRTVAHNLARQWSTRTSKKRWKEFLQQEKMSSPKEKRKQIPKFPLVAENNWKRNNRTHTGRNVKNC